MRDHSNPLLLLTKAIKHFLDLVCPKRKRICMTQQSTLSPGLERDTPFPPVLKHTRMKGFCETCNHSIIQSFIQPLAFFHIHEPFTAADNLLLLKSGRAQWIHLSPPPSKKRLLTDSAAY